MKPVLFTIDQGHFQRVFDEILKIVRYIRLERRVQRTVYVQLANAIVEHMREFNAVTRVRSGSRQVKRTGQFEIVRLVLDRFGKHV